MNVRIGQVFSLSLLVLSSTLLMGCQGVSLSTVNSASALHRNQGQILPPNARLVIDGQEILLEVAQTSDQQALGLMYREYLSPHQGMLFPFEFPRRASFWMKNVPISLDLIFLYQGKVQAMENSAPPCLQEPCPIYSPDVLVDQVLELAGGRALELGISIGDVLPIESISVSQ
ncbi:MAG: DUF192 domain-containing protein [Cyanobacterium sp. T60_A2020_053]|nr:DUF192 domain-containing protein [Cyanobacterium sp. T60_A2020_053]